MHLRNVPGRIAHMIGYMASDPGQIRYAGAWLPTLRRSTVELRMPWLPYRVIDRVGAHLTPRSRVAEYGGGGSTLWFADRAGEVLTIEHDVEWFPLLENSVAGLANCRVMHKSSDDDYGMYVAALEHFPDGYFDVIVVDGRERVRCLEAAIPKVASGGLLILDDSERDRYERAFDAVKWPHVTYRGLTPTKTVAGVTTVWQRPA